MPLFVPQSLLQTTFDSIAVDTTTTSTTMVDLMSTVITTSGGALCIFFVGNASATASNETILFRLLVDGVQQIGCGVRNSQANISECASIAWRTSPLSPGSHTVLIQWSIPSVGTAQILPATSSNATSNATLLIQEVTV